MSETNAERERARDLDRLLTFVDAIVAIAITLLVLPLVDLAGELASGGSVSELLHRSRPLIGAFFLSFAVIANLWLTQHRMLRHLVASSDPITMLLMLWSVTIVFLPFPTALVSARGGVSDQPLTKLLYVGTMAMSSVLLAFVSLLVHRDRSLRDSDVSPDPWLAFGVTATFGLALAVMLLVPATGYLPLLLLILTDRFVDLTKGRLRRGRGVPQPRR
ncbi:MAG: TMEM175 family protein [Nocardioides sp.]